MTVLRDAEVAGNRCDLRLHTETGRITGLAPTGTVRPAPDEEVIDAAGGALLPGLHDHHLHLMAIAAADASVEVRGGLDPLAALDPNPALGWVRAVGASNETNARALDAVLVSRPVRVAHRSGAMWVLNSAAMTIVGLASAGHAGIERDATGAPTGRLFRMDDWLALRIGTQQPDLTAVGARLARYGITAVTDATPNLDRATAALLRSAVPQQVSLLGDPDGDGPVKIVVADSGLPSPASLLAEIHRARPRPVAVHCVTRVALVLTLDVLDTVGRIPGDRIEHAAVVPPQIAGRLPAVVTQPGFIADRGDDYLADVDPDDLPCLYPYASLLAAGIPTVASSDAPYGPLDPWAVMRAARDRRTPAGVVLGAHEVVSTATALDGYLSPTPGALPRMLSVGDRADVVLLSVALREALADPSPEMVRATWIGAVAH